MSKPEPIIAGIRGTSLIIIHPATRTEHSIDVKDIVYAGLVAEAINKQVPKE